MNETEKMLASESWSRKNKMEMVDKMGGHQVINNDVRGVNPTYVSYASIMVLCLTLNQFLDEFPCAWLLSFTSSSHLFELNLHYCFSSSTKIET